jgi:LPS-assembly protein
MRLGCLLLLGILLVSSAAAHAQADRKRLFNPAGDVTLLADSMEEREGVLIATGNVEVTHGPVRLSADRMEYDRGSGVAIASGRVVFYDGADRLTGERIEYNTRTGTGVVHRGQVFSAPYYHLSGEQMERVDESVYRVYRGVFTTCEDDPPSWSFRARTVTADLDDFVFGRDASFWVKSVPVIPLIPFFSAPMRRERQTGFLIPTVGSSSRRGVFAKIPFFWAIDDSQDLTVSLDAFSERGVGVNGEYRYVLSENAQGALSGFVIHEVLESGDVRAYGGFKHSWTIDPSLSFRADLNVVNDDRVLRVYGDRLNERSLQRAESNIFLTKRFENWNLVGNILWYQDLTSDRPIELQRVPDLRAQSVRAPVPWVPGFLYEIEGSFTNFLREEGSEGVRVDFHPRLFYPIPVGGYFTLTPFVGGRATYYNIRVIGLHPIRTGATIEQTEAASRIRAIAEFGTDLESRASRIYQWKGFWNVDRAQHVLEPRVNFTRAIATNASGTPRWDTIDENFDRTRVTYSLTNRLLTKTIGDVDAAPVRWEMIRLAISQFYEFEQPSRGLGPITADLIFQPSYLFQFRGDIEQDVTGRGLRRSSTDATLRLENFTATVGTQFNDLERIEFLRGLFTARVSKYLTVRGGTGWDVRASTFVENRLGFDLHWQCWSFSFTYINRKKDDNEVRVSLNLLGLGAIGTRTDLGY